MKTSRVTTGQQMHHETLWSEPGVPSPRPPWNIHVPSNPFGNKLYGAGSELIRGGLGAYGDRIFTSTSESVQSNIQYYFQVDDHYVKNKLKLVLFPFWHRGHWTRITAPVGGRLSYRPPTHDINAPDLYIPVMAFATYTVLAGISLGLSGKFCPEALNWQFAKGTIGWLLQVMLLKVSLFSLGGGEAPLLDTIAYAGYTFTGMCLAMLGRITSLECHTCYLIIIWTCLCMSIFLVKTLKPTMYTEFRSYSSKQHYLLIGIAFAQFPLICWLSNTTGSSFF